MTSSESSVVSADVTGVGVFWAKAGAPTKPRASANGATPARRAVRVDLCIAVPFRNGAPLGATSTRNPAGEVFVAHRIGPIATGRPEMDERSCTNAAHAAKFLVARATTLRCECNQ